MTGKAASYSVRIGLLSVLLLISGVIFAQAPKFQAITSKTTVGEGERLKVEYRFNASGENFTPPKFEGFRILSGPNQSTNMQFINGKSSYSIAFSYVLMALKEGEVAIPPASINLGPEVFYSNELNINIIKGSAQAQNQGGQTNKTQGNTNQNQGGNNSARSQGNSEIDENIFIRSYISDANPYVGEQITATYKLYFNYNIVDNNFTTLPSLNGFWSEELDIKGNQRQTEVIGGIRYNVAILKRSILIPQRSGELFLDPLEMDLIIQVAEQSRSRNLFDQFFGNYKNVKVSVKSAPLKVEVKSLPSGRPSSFNGAVGTFKVNLIADRTDVKSNEAINLKYEISGRGNLKLLNEPKIDFPSDFEVYDPKVNDQINVNDGGMSGNRSYNYLTIPRHKGKFTIEPIPFTYFDPSKGSFITLNTALLEFNIEKGQDETGTAVNFSGTNKEDIKFLGSDIRFIKTNTVLLPMGYSFFGSFWHYLLWLLPLPLFAFIWVIKGKVDEKRGDAVYMKKSKANRMATKRLSNAKKLLASKDDKKFYEEIFKALYGFFEDKFNLNTSEINKEKIRETLVKNGIDEALTDRIENLLNQCEMARFAPVSNVSHEQIYQEAITLLSAVQKGIK